MTALVEIWGASFGIGVAVGLGAFLISYPFQIFKQGVEQI